MDPGRAPARAGLAVLAVALAMFLVPLVACGGAEADAGREEILEIVRRDAVIVDGPSLPDPILDRLAEYQVVILGETHHLREHWALVAALLADLHARGFRQLLIEAPHMADWLFDDYVRGGDLEPDFELPEFWRRKLEPIRQFNDGLPPGERVHLRAIDVNEDHYGGAESFRGLLGLRASHLPSAGPIDAFLAADYTTADAQRVALESLLTSLSSSRAVLVADWGDEAFAAVLEMAEVERLSVDVRAERPRNDARAARAREDAIKDLADARLRGFAHRTVINIGAHHAQKAPLMGTDQEWLGDYLVHRSTGVGGPVFVMSLAPAETLLEPGASGAAFDILDEAPAHELRRIIAEVFRGDTVFLPLDDPLFSGGTVAIYSDGEVYVATIARQFDALLQYGPAHRMPDH